MNVSTNISNSLELNQISALEMLGNVASQINVDAFLIGGSVRDLILGIKLKDIDVCVESDIQTFIDAIPSKDIEICSVSQFGTAKIKIFGQTIDLAMTRTEFYSESGVLPTVVFSNIYDDIYRRDFTVNTMCVFLNSNRWGDLLDKFGGLSDLESRKIRALHPTSFIDDPTRVFRAFRYASRLEFKIEKITSASIELDEIKKLSGIRISNELKRIFSEGKFIKILEELEDFGVLRSVYNNLFLSDHLLHVFSNNHEAIVRYPDYGILAMAFDISDMKHRIEFSTRLQLPKNLIKAIDDIKYIEKMPSEKPSELYYLLNDVSELTLAVAKLYKSKEIKDQIDLFLNKLKHTKLKINGEDLLKKGISGPDIGYMLKKIKSILLDDGVADNKSDQMLILDQLIIENNET
ncbi:MAG: CCA tRNA nucleotidyltransferase [Dehalococcoidia bacterium]